MFYAWLAGDTSAGGWNRSHTKDGITSGLFISDHLSAWKAPADLLAERHIHWLDWPFQRVLTNALPMYDEQWTCAKAIYRLEPAVAVGGEVVIYAPHVDAVGHTHGRYIMKWDITSCLIS